MSRQRKLLLRILSGHSDASIRFSDLRYLLRSLGFVERTHGSHHIFVRRDIEERITLQRDGPHAKPYQVRQVRKMMRRNRIGREE